MPTNIDETSVYTKLRHKAEGQLRSGTTAPTGQWSMGVDALRLLHRLSSNPDNADDALKLLHELQVHQVELDLQNEEIADNERALEEELDLYRTLYDCAPMAYCVVDFEGAIIQGNLAAAELFAIGKNEMEGQPIGTFLEQKSQPILLDLLHRVSSSGMKGSCVAEMAGGDQGPRQLQLLASISPEQEHILLVCCVLGNEE